MLDAGWAEEADRLSEQVAQVDQFKLYLNEPVGFCKDILGLELIEKQKQIMTSLLLSPYRVLVPAANEVGKTVVAAACILWWHTTRVSVIISTAPKFQQVKDVLWKEVRRLAAGAKLPIKFLPKDCRIERAADDFAVGTTARDSTSFQGHHGPSILFVVDEGTGVEPEMFEAIEGMFSPPGHALLVLFNPTKQGTVVHQEMMRSERQRPSEKAWHVFRMSALEHPNSRGQALDQRRRSARKGNCRRGRGDGNRANTHRGLLAAQRFGGRGWKAEELTSRLLTSN